MHARREAELKPCVRNFLSRVVYSDASIAVYAVGLTEEDMDKPQV